jgi:hypothetical protein
VQPSDKQLLDEARRRLKTTERKLHAAELIAMIVTQFRAPIGGNDPIAASAGRTKVCNSGNENGPAST